MENLRNTKNLVREALRVSKKARNSDDYLYYLVCKSIMQTEGYKIDQMSFQRVMLKRKEYGLPGYETVRRTRQKCQQEYPDLRADADVEAERVIREEAYREFARKG